MSLDFILFQGNLFGPLTPPPGAPPGAAPPSLVLPLNQLFALTIVGYVVLLLVLWFVAPQLGALRWVGDVLLMGYVVILFGAWLRFGGPNPRGFLGYLSKGIEVVLFLALLVRAWPAIAGNKQADART